MALAGLAALQQRGEDAAVGVHACCDVGNGGAGLAGFVGRARDGDEAGFALDQQVVRLLVAIGPGMLRIVAIAGEIGRAHV